MQLCFNYNFPVKGTGFGTVSAGKQMVARGSLSLVSPLFFIIQTFFRTGKMLCDGAKIQPNLSATTVLPSFCFTDSGYCILNKHCIS
jgi:hypothetical protein